MRQIDRTYDVAKMRDTLREALTTKEPGPKIIVASSECMLNKQRRVKPLFAKAVKDGKRMVKERFGVDEDVCTGDHACIRLSGCPSLSVKHTDDPLKDDPVAAIDNNCVGCGNCGEVSEAAVLCPSFYRADIIHNPTGWDRFLARMRGAVIGWLQARRQAAPHRLCGLRDRHERACQHDQYRHQPSVDRQAAVASPSSPWAGRAAVCWPTGSSGLPKPRAGWRSRPRCPAWPSAPARRSTTSKCCPPATVMRRSSR